jgi:hypothetical protein
MGRTSIPSAGFEHAIPEIERLQTCNIARTAKPCILIHIYRRFEGSTAFIFRIRQSEKILFLGCLTLKMKAL